MKVRRALVSVSDKSGIIEFCKALSEMGVEIISTGGTAKALADAGVPVMGISDVTKFPEMLARLDSVYGALRAELEMHLMKEETVLFPAIKDIEAAHAAARPPRPMPFGTVRNPIHMMEHEHDNAGEALRLMRSLTGDYTAPEGACPTFHALYRGLDALEQDLHVHIHLENNILFPRAAELETRQG